MHEYMHTMPHAFGLHMGAEHIPISVFLFFGIYSKSKHGSPFLGALWLAIKELKYVIWGLQQWFCTFLGLLCLFCWDWTEALFSYGIDVALFLWYRCSPFSQMSWMITQLAMQSSLSSKVPDIRIFDYIEIQKVHWFWPFIDFDQ